MIRIKKTNDTVQIIMVLLIILDVTSIVFESLPFLTPLRGLLSYLIWAAVLVMAFLTVSMQRKVPKYFTVFWLIITSMIVSMVLSSTAMSATSVYGILGFLILFFMYFWVSKIEINPELVHFIYKAALCKAIYFAVISITPVAFLPYYSSDNIAIYDGSMTLGYTNPNVTAIYIYLTFCVLLSEINSKNYKNKKKLLSLILSVILYILILKTQSRIMIICLPLFIILSILQNVKWIRNLLLNRVTIAIIISSPLVFLLVYRKIYTDYPQLLFFGKEMFSRITIYERSFSVLKLNPLFGDIILIHFGNTHNGLLSILASIGYVGLGFYLIFIFLLISGFTNNYKQNRQASIVPLLAIYVIFIHESVEAALICGNNVMTISQLIIFYLIRYNLEAEENAA